jgi:membrane dipeptidase
MSDLTYRRDADAPTLPLATPLPLLAARAERLLAGPVASVHEHPVRLPEPLDAQTWARHMDGMQDVLAVEELERSGLDLVIATCFSQPRLDFIVHWAESLAAQTSASGGLALLTDRAQLEAVAARPERAGVAVLLGLEDLGPVASLDDIRMLAARGIRSAGVAYTSGSPLGCGAGQQDTGLTAFGRDAIALMNEIGMAVDVSHAGRRTSLDAIEASAVPVMINHAGAAAIWPSPRMITDDVVIAAAARGGLIGIEAAPGSTRTRLDSPEHGVEDIVRHIEYCAGLVGVQAVALGGDTFYGDHVGLYGALGSTGAVVPAGAIPFAGSVVAGADHPGEMARQVCAALLRNGWYDADIARVLGGNALRVLRATLPEAAA